MAFTVLEDMTASVEVVVFPETFARCSHLLGSEQPLIVQGSVQVSERGANIIADSVLPLNEALEQLTEKAVIRLRSDRVGRPQLTALKDLFYQFHGTVPIKITLHFDGRGEADIEPHPDMAVRPCADFFRQLRQQFGRDCRLCRCGRRRRGGRRARASATVPTSDDEAGNSWLASETPRTCPATKQRQAGSRAGGVQD
jgi:DNA polymerase-3 subunit alpha